MFLVPILDNQLICKYPWYAKKDINLLKQTNNLLLLIGYVLTSPFIGVLYIFWQMINTRLIPRAKLENSGLYLISSAIHFEEFSNLPDKKIGFWGNMKDLQELKDLKPTYILVPYKQISPHPIISQKNYNVEDLRALRSKYFFIKYFTVFLLSNLYFIYKLIPILYGYFFKNTTILTNTIQNYKYVLGKNLSSSIYLKLLFIDFNTNIKNRSNILYSCEGQSWEFSLLVSNTNHSKFYGNLQIPFRENDTQIKSYALIKRFKTPKEINFITVGNRSSKRFIQIIGAQFKIIEAEGQRFISAGLDVNLRSKFDHKSISLYLDTDVQTNKKLVEMICKFTIEMNFEKLYIYDHPSLVNKKIYPKEDSYITINPEKPSKISSINIFSPSTSVVINPKFFGTVVAVYQPYDGASVLWETRKKIFFNDKKSLLMIIKNNQTFTDSDLDNIVDLNVDLHLWRKFLGTLVD